MPVGRVLDSEWDRIGSVSPHARDAESRRQTERASWPVRRLRLGGEPGDDMRALTTAEQRLEMMWPLALGAWTLTGRPLPQYRREDAPVRLLELSALRKS